MVIGHWKRLELIKTQPQLREKLWTVVNALQSDLKPRASTWGIQILRLLRFSFPVLLLKATNVVIDLRENYRIFCSMVIYP